MWKPTPHPHSLSGRTEGGLGRCGRVIGSWEQHYSMDVVEAFTRNQLGYLGNTDSYPCTRRLDVLIMVQAVC